MLANNAVILRSPHIKQKQDGISYFIQILPSLLFISIHIFLRFYLIFINKELTIVTSLIKKLRKIYVKYIKHLCMK